MNKKLFAIMLLAGTAAANNALAGAWTQKKGEGQVIVSVSTYSTDSFFNEASKKVAPSGEYEKQEISLYAEYGLHDAYTFGLQTSFQNVTTEGATGKANDRDLADTTLFLRERLWQGSNDVISIQQAVTIPGPYDQNSDAALGYGQVDLEFRALYGHSGEIFGFSYFTDANAAYRKRYDVPADEVKIDMTLGFRPHERVMLLAQSFNTIGMGNESGSSFATASGPDYDLYKGQISAVVDVGSGYSVQFGGNMDLAGRNTGAGKGFFLSLWKSF